MNRYKKKKLCTSVLSKGLKAVSEGSEDQANHYQDYKELDPITHTEREVNVNLLTTTHISESKHEL